MGSFPEKYNDPFALGYKGEPYNDKCNHPRGLIVPFRLRPSLQRRKGNPGARVYPSKQVTQSTRIFLLFSHDVFTRQVGLP